MMLMSGLERFPCHRLLLAAVSPLLKEILEPFSIEEEVIISLPGYTQQEIDYLLGVLYGEEAGRGQEPELYTGIVTNLQIRIPQLRKPSEIQRKNRYIINLADEEMQRSDPYKGVSEPLFYIGDKSSHLNENADLLYGAVGATETAWNKGKDMKVSGWKSKHSATSGEQGNLSPRKEPQEIIYDKEGFAHCLYCPLTTRKHENNEYFIDRLQLSNLLTGPLLINTIR